MSAEIQRRLAQFGFAAIPRVPVMIARGLNMMQLEHLFDFQPPIDPHNSR